MLSAKQYIDLIEAERATIDRHSAGLLTALRGSAIEELKAQGLPTRKSERWLYTDAGKLFAPNYGINLRQRPLSYTLPTVQEGEVVMVNDRLDPGSHKSEEGVLVGDFGRAERELPQVAARHLGRLAKGDGVAALGSALAQEGLFVYVAPGVKAARPLQVQAYTAGPDSLLVARRGLIVVGEGARLNLTLRDSSDAGYEWLTLSTTEIVVEQGAQLTLNMLSETGHTLVDNLYIEQGAGSRVQIYSFTLRSALTRREINHRFAGEGARLRLQGVVAAGGTEHVDQNLLIDHARGNCESDVLYKYVLDGDAVGAFAGRVLVREEAAGTVSALRNANLSVSPRARVYAQPMLEIYADDVKCSHGSTVGQLDEAALFYMNQRGIEPEVAQQLLKQAFLSEVINKLPLSPLRNHVCELCNLCS